MSDNILYELSNMSETVSEPFVKRELAYVIDQNSQSYNGQIQIETSSLANSGKLISYSEAYLEIPLVVALKSSIDITGAAGPNSFMVGLKNGFHQLIDSIQVDYNNRNVIQLTPFTNFYISYKLMSSFSKDDVAKYGAVLNFFPDSATAFNYQAAASVNGGGTSNNVVYQLTAVTYATASYKGDSYNDGFLKRLQNCGYNPASGAAASGFSGAINAILNTAALCNAIGRSYWTNDAGAGAARVYYWSIMATIRLKDISDFFERIPLVRGGTLKITINTNTSSNSITATAAGTTLNVGATGDVTIVGRTNPLLVASAAANNPLNVVVAAGDQTLSVACGISSVTVGGVTVTHQILRSCRLYVPLYTGNPTYVDQYLKLNPTKEIVYRDIYNFNIIGVAAGQSNTTLLTNGIINPKALIIVPILNTAAGNNMTVALPPHQSPFSSEPATTSPLAAITQFQVQVSGVNLFSQNLQYDWSLFLDEVKSMNAVNGGVTTGLTSGLIGFEQWQNGYRYAVADLSRRLPMDDSVPKSIQVQLTNNTAKTFDYYCFIEFQRSVTLSLTDGNVL